MLAATSSRDNWERLVAAVLKRDQIWHLCHQDSITTISSSDFSQRLLSFSSTDLRDVSLSPSLDKLPLTNDSVDVEDKIKPSETITQKLFSTLLRRRKPPKVYDPGEGLVGIPEDHFGVESFSLRELLVATDNFSNKNILGHGGHDHEVYKGRLADGSLVAIKRFRAQTDQVKINNELEISSSLVAHRNVLHLRGLCFTQTEQLFVYPYMANGSVASWLRERSESQAPLSWAVRQWIALGAAKGLAYMHHECVKRIIHRDIKAANILLDEDFEAVVAGFSLAKFDDAYSTGLYGTVGHIAPEYLYTGKCSNKTDVYGFGIFLLELATGKRSFDLCRLANNEDTMLLDWARKLYKRKVLKVMVDEDLGGNFVKEDMEKLFQIALICTRSNPEGRPTMPEVVRMLEDGGGLAERGENLSHIVWEIMAKRWQDLSQNVCESDQNYYSGEGLVGIPEDHFGVESFSLHELLVGTNHFSNKNILGRGGHSTVYKGRLADGSLVAIKRFRAQNDKVMINNELKISSSLVAHRNRNVLHLRGLCFTQTEQLFVYPYMANGSVASCLRARSESQAPLSWAVRQCIALGAAKGLAYMHHECRRNIIHRDIKAANILLDEGFEAVVADFSLAKFDDGYNTRVYGTAGHVAPEYLATGKCSAKADVYGYGIFLLELVTGRRAFDLGRVANYEDLMLLDWVRKLFNRKSFEVMADQDVEGNFAEEDMEKLFQIALICTRSDPEGRPTMPEVVRMLRDGDGLAERWQDLSHNVWENMAEKWQELYQNARESMADRWQVFSNCFCENDNWYGIHECGIPSSSNASEDELSGPR